MADGEAALSLGMLPSLLGYHLRRAQVAVFRHFARTVSAEADITPSLFGMLQVIAANPGLTPSGLAEAMGVDKSAIVKVVNQLGERGLIWRAPLPNDRRSHCLPLTPQGAAALARMEALVLAHEDEFAKGLTAEEKATLIRLLQKLAEQGRESA